MKEIYKKHNKSLKIFIFVLCFMMITGKILSDYSPYILIKNAFENTVNKHKSAFSKSYLLSAQLSYKTSDGNKKTINTLFDDTVVGISLDGPDSIYYTIPVDNIKTILKSDYIKDLFSSGKLMNRSSNPAFVIPSLFSLEFNKNVDLKLLEKAFSKIQLINNKDSFLSKEKSFSLVIPSESITEIIDCAFIFEPQTKTSLNDIFSVKDGDYLLDIEIYGDSLKKIKCITPSIYCIQINFDYPKICLSIENDLYDWSGGNVIFTLLSERECEENKYREKSIYSLTVGELIEITQQVSDNL